MVDIKYTIGAGAINKIIGIAKGEVNKYPERWWGDSTHSYYCTWYGKNDLWCAIFISWLAAAAGFTSIIPHEMSTIRQRNLFDAMGRYTVGTAGIRRGDIVYMKTSSARGEINHVGIVESVNADGTPNTIDGNTSNPDFPGSEDTGGCVAWKRRPFSVIRGYARPDYAAVDSDPGAPPNPWSPRPVIGGTTTYLAADGYWGLNTTRALQKRFGTYIDGEIWGQYSAHKANNPALVSGWKWTTSPTGSPLIKAMQTWLGVGADGIAGPGTFTALQRRLGMKYADGVLSARSPAVAEMQRRLNAGTL